MSDALPIGNPFVNKEIMECMQDLDKVGWSLKELKLEYPTSIKMLEERVNNIREYLQKNQLPENINYTEIKHDIYDAYKSLEDCNFRRADECLRNVQDKLGSRECDFDGPSKDDKNKENEYKNFGMGR